MSPISTGAATGSPCSSSSASSASSASTSTSTSTSSSSASSSPPRAAHPASASRPAADSSSEESTDSWEQERKKEKKQEEEKRKKEKKKEDKKKEEAAGGWGVKEEEAATDIEEVKTEVEDMAVEGEGAGGGGGGFGCDPREAGHAWGLNQANQRNVLTLPWAQGALDSGYSPNAPLFSSPEVTNVTLRCAFRRMLRHRIRNKGEGGGAGRYGGGGGAWAWKPLAGKPLSPIPEPVGAGDLTPAHVIWGPGGRLMRRSHWELWFLHLEERGWVKLQRSGRKLECIPQWESIWGGGGV